MAAKYFCSHRRYIDRAHGDNRHGVLVGGVSRPAGVVHNQEPLVARNICRKSRFKVLFRNCIKMGNACIDSFNFVAKMGRNNKHNTLVALVMHKINTIVLIIGYCVIIDSISSGTLIADFMYYINKVIKLFMVLVEGT